MFIHLGAVGFGVCNRSLGVLYYGLGVHSIGVGLVAVGVNILLHRQSVACSQGQGAARFGSSGSGCAYGVAAGSDVEAAVVDDVGNITGSNQFVGISGNRSNHFAGRVAAGAITYSQRSSGYSSF